MPHTRLKFKLPGGAFEVSTEHPDEEFRIVAAFPMDDELFVAFEAPTAVQQAVIHYFDESPLSYELLHTDEQSVLFQYEMPFIPPLGRAILASGTLVQFPLTLRDGWITLDLTTSHERLSLLKAEFDDAGFTYEVNSVTQSTQQTELLTDRQQRFMIEALGRGYYDTPRECTLTELADELDVGKSTASRVLHNAEGTIIKEFFAEPID